MTALYSLESLTCEATTHVRAEAPKLVYRWCTAVRVDLI